MKNIVICDIDDTISITGDRNKYLKENSKNWDAFFDHCHEDEPIPEMIELVKYLHEEYLIIFCTGRPERCRRMTQGWIHNNTNSGWKQGIDYHLLMRKNGDNRCDSVVKPELILNSGIDLLDISFVLEDRDRVVQAYRKMGLRVLQVAEGNF